ncbi:hypothetical protein COO72_12435 [Bifidobacterium callitrichos]|nr:hypothetical protein COO72_12435 [Bifidobacterium callitrichos]
MKAVLASFDEISIPRTPRREATTPDTIGSLTGRQRALLEQGERSFTATSMRQLRTYRVLERLGLIKADNRFWRPTPRGLAAIR